MMHGTFDIYTAWSVVGDEGNTGVSHEISTPTTDHPTVNYNDSTAQATRDSVSHTVVVGASGAYQVAEGLRAFGQLDYINVNNYGNIEGQKESDVQLTLGITYSL
jgi:predicted porin